MTVRIRQTLSLLAMYLVSRGCLRVRDAAVMRGGLVPRGDRFLVGIVFTVAGGTKGQLPFMLGCRWRWTTVVRGRRRRTFTRIHEALVKAADLRIVHVEVDRCQAHLIHPLGHFVARRTVEIFAILSAFVGNTETTRRENGQCVR